MADEYVQPSEAARRLGISVTTLYDWLSQSDYGLLKIRGETVTIQYLQSGPAGHGRIRIASAEIDRIMECMRVRPTGTVMGRPPMKQSDYPGITVPLGCPRPHQTS